MPRLFIGLDVFCPGAYPPPPGEAPGADADALFLVIQPSIVKTGGDAIDPLAYFRLGGGELGKAIDVTFFDRDRLDAEKAAVEDGMMVPLPPEARLRLDYKPAPGAPPLSRERQLPSLDPHRVTCPSLYLPCGEWPDFAEASFALPSLNDYAQISHVAADRRPSMVRGVESWAIAATSAIIDTHRRWQADPTSRPLTPSEAAALDGPRRTIAALFQGSGTPTDEELRARLRAPAGNPIAGQLWTMLTAAFAREALLSPPPRLLHDRDSLARDPVGLLGLGDPGNPPSSSAYHRALWLRLSAMARSSDPSRPSDERYRTLSDTLGRLFGFGERLRWPGRLVDPDMFMVLKNDSVRALRQGWDAVGTNAHSLLGQVFRLPFAAKDPIDRDARLTLSIGAQRSLDLMPAVRDVLAEMASPPAFAATLGRDADRPGGFFVYTPRMAEATLVGTPQPLAAGSPAGGLPDVVAAVHAVPAALLDAVDPAARVSSAEEDGVLQRQHPARNGLRVGELHLTDALGPRTRALSLAARLAPMPSSARDSRLFKLLRAATPHPGEAAETLARVLSDVAGGEVWVPGAGGAAARWRMTGRLLSAETTEQGGWRVVLADRDGSLAALAAAAPAPAQGTRRDDDAGLDVELILPMTAGASLFNRLLTGDPPIGAAPLCILNARFASQFSRSTDRLLERFEARLTPSPLDPRVGPVTQAFAGFYKLRLAMSSADSAVTSRWESPSRARLAAPEARISLTYPDAMVPVDAAGYRSTLPPWQVGAPPDGDRLYSYFISHIFTQDSRADDVAVRVPAGENLEAANRRARNAAESLRYLNYLTPAAPWTITGDLEQRYSCRVRTAGPDIDLPLTTAIVHAGQAMQGDSPELGKTPDRTPLLHWRFDERAGTLILGFPIRYLAQVMREGEDIRPARLRAIYEPLADLLLAIDAGEARLRLQGWVFAADGADHALASDEDDVGDISANMRLAFSATHQVKASEVPDLKAARALLSQPFTLFEEAVGTLAKGKAATWMEWRFPVAAPEWIGLDARPPQEIARSVDVLRLGLSIARPDTHVVRPASRTDPGFPLEPDAEQVDAYPALRAHGFSNLRDAAAAELVALTAPDDGSQPHPSPLRRKFAWLRSLPHPAASVTAETNPEMVDDPRRFARLFGEAAAFSVHPLASRPPIDRVLDLYYVPLAFRPLRAHREIGDPATTLEFAEFLVRVLGDLAHGRPEPGGVDILAGTPDAAHAAAGYLESRLLPGVAKLLSELVLWVHADPSHAAKDLLAYVHQQTKAALSAGARAELARMLTSRPQLFLTSQGFGFAWVNQTEWVDRLHSLQIRKRIEPSSSGMRDDVDRFNFRSFFNAGPVTGILDVLDDVRYDTEFQIERPTYRPARQPHARDGAVRAQVRSVGDVTARTGEDVIDTAHPFDMPAAGQAPGDRPLLVDAVHWNPDWVDPASGPLYLLPSRRFPTMPLKVTRDESVDAASRPSKLSIDLSIPKPDLDAELAEQLARYLDDKAIPLSLGADARFTAEPMDNPAAFGARITDGQPIGAKRPVAEGWWAVDAYASEHYFIVEDDKENDRQPFVADLFEIEAELDVDPFGESPVAAPAAFQPKDGLGQWFQYSRLRNSTPDADVPRPAAMTQRTVIAALERWLMPDDPEDGLLRIDTPAPAAAAGGGGTRTLTRFVVSANSSTAKPPPRLWEHQRVSGNGSGVGAVLRADILKLRADVADRTAKPAHRYVLRVVLLDDRWRYSRVRVRLVRNARDVSGDLHPDINSAFHLLGAYSAWSGRQLVGGAIDFITDRKGRPSDLTDLRPTPCLAEFRAASGPLRYGPVIERALSASFVDSKGRSQPMWHHQPDADLEAAGMILQKRHDLHPRYANGDLATTVRGVVRTRVGERPLQHLRTNGPAVVVEVDRGLVLTPFHQVRVTWSRHGTPVLTCTWPVMFDR